MSIRTEHVLIEGSRRSGGMYATQGINASAKQCHPAWFPCYEVFIRSDHLQHDDCTAWHHTKTQGSTLVWHDALSSLSALQRVDTIPQSTVKGLTWEAVRNMVWVRHAQGAVMINLRQRCQQRDRMHRYLLKAQCNNSNMIYDCIC